MGDRKSRKTGARMIGGSLVWAPGSRNPGVVSVQLENSRAVPVEKLRFSPVEPQKCVSKIMYKFTNKLETKAILLQKIMFKFAKIMVS